MKYKINTKIEFKADSLDNGKIVGFEEDTNMYIVELPSGNTIKCTYQYFKDKKK
tara:strand:- start:335 stop:496 length:162 start_codon:yes stop_codon:yes gene_type:complete